MTEADEGELTAGTYYACKDEEGYVHLVTKVIEGDAYSITSVELGTTEDGVRTLNDDFELTDEAVEFISNFVRNFNLKNLPKDGIYPVALKMVGRGIYEYEILDVIESGEVASVKTKEGNQVSFVSDGTTYTILDNAELDNLFVDAPDSETVELGKKYDLVLFKGNVIVCNAGEFTTQIPTTPTFDGWAQVLDSEVKVKINEESILGGETYEIEYAKVKILTDAGKAEVVDLKTEVKKVNGEWKLYAYINADTKVELSYETTQELTFANDVYAYETENGVTSLYTVDDVSDAKVEYVVAYAKIEKNQTTFDGIIIKNANYVSNVEKDGTYATFDSTAKFTSFDATSGSGVIVEKVVLGKEEVKSVVVIFGEAIVDDDEPTATENIVYIVAGEYSEARVDNGPVYTYTGYKADGKTVDIESDVNTLGGFYYLNDDGKTVATAKVVGIEYATVTKLNGDYVTISDGNNIYVKDATVVEVVSGLEKTSENSSYYC